MPLSRLIYIMKCASNNHYGCKAVFLEAIFYNGWTVDFPNGSTCHHLTDLIIILFFIIN